MDEDGKNCITICFMCVCYLELFFILFLSYQACSDVSYDAGWYKHFSKLKTKFVSFPISKLVY